METRKPVPESRTIVPGNWSDLLDLWHASFIDDGDEVSLGVKFNDLKSLSILLDISFSGMREQNDEMIKQLKLLNLRFEEMADTKINEKDIGD